MKRKLDETDLDQKNQTDQKKKRAEELQKKIQQSLLKIQSQKIESVENQITTKNTSINDTLTMTDDGKLFDSEGNMIYVKKQQVSTLINKKFQGNLTFK
jgi:hypothetical protein